MMPIAHGLDRGIEDVARSANAYLTAGLTQALKLRLDATDADIRRPLIGVFPLGVTQGHDILIENRAGRSVYPLKTHGPMQMARR